MGDYDAVELKPTWGGVSVGFFAIIVLFLGTVVFLAGAYRGFHFWSVVVVLTVPALSLVGSILGLVGLRRSASRTVAWLGTVLNLTVLVSCIVALILSRSGA